MPIDYSQYPPDWKDITARIRKREHDACKWCGAPNGKQVWRLREEWLSIERLTPLEWAPKRAILGGAGESYLYHLVKIVLTVAHLNHDITDNRDENLAALCQYHHLWHDRHHHAKNAKATRRRKKIKAGQMELAE